MGTVTLAARALLALVFATAGVAKLRDPEGTRNTFRGFGTSERLAALVPLLAPTELAVACGLVLTVSARWAAAFAVLLLLVFIAGIVSALRAGRTPDCGCFGGLRPEPIGPRTLVRNGVLAALAVLVAVAGPTPGVGDWANAHTTVELVTVLLAVVAAAAAIVFGGGVGADAQSGGGTVTPGLAALPPMVTLAGRQALEFTLTDLDGQEWTLARLCDTGRPVVLVFVNSTCGSCLTVLPDVARWQVALAGGLSLVLVGTGDPTRMRSACIEQRIGLALLDEPAGVAGSYAALAMPSAVAVSADGRITSGPVNGGDAIEDLIRLTLNGESTSARA